MSKSARVALILAGYAAALAVAFVVVAVYGSSRDPALQQSQGGMAAFGDSLLFLGVFCIAAVPSTAAVLFTLREHPRFWRVGSVVMLCIAVTGLPALFVYVHPTPFTSNGWWELSPLRVLVAPAFALGSGLAGLFAPERRPRLALFGAAAIETVVFVWVVTIWTMSNR